MRHIKFARRTKEENIQRKEDKQKFYDKKKEEILFVILNTISSVTD